MPKSSGAGESAPAAETPAERKQALRAQIAEYEQRAGHPTPGALKEEGLEEKILSLEGELHGIEKAERDATRNDRIVAIRAQIADLEQRAGHPTPGALKEQGLEEQILKLEDELRAIEREGQPAVASTVVAASPSESMPEAAAVAPEAPTAGVEAPVIATPEIQAAAETLAPETPTSNVEAPVAPAPETPTAAATTESPSSETPEQAPAAETPVEQKPDLTRVDPLAYYGYDKPPQVERPDLTGVDPLEYYGYAASALEQRKAELDTEALQLGSKEGSWIKAIGEQYNKIPFKYKLAVGLTLTAAAGIGTAFAAPALLYSSVIGLAAQRVAGGLGMFVKFDDRLIATQSETHGMSETERQSWAAAQSLVYGVLMGKMVQLGVEAAGHAIDASGLHDWVIAHWPGHAAPIDVAPPPGPLETGMSLEHEMDMSMIPQTPDVSVHASAGHGYEFMVKRLWEQLQDKGLDPSQYAENSDLHRLLTTDAAHIDQVVHQIAADPQHHFFNADGTSVLMKPEDVMTIGPDGQIHVGGPSHFDVVQAPEGAATTPPYNPEAAQAPEMESPAAPHTEILTDSAPQAPEATSVAESITNSHGFPVIESQSHIYASTSGDQLYAHGGTAAEKAQMIREFFADPANAGKTIISSDANNNYQIPFSMQNGNIMAGQPLRGGGLLGFFGSFRKAPGADDLGPMIK
jgi:hypothetical protein